MAAGGHGRLQEDRSGSLTISRLLAKRAVDLIIGIPLAIMAIPVIAVLAVGVLITLRDWPFFVQGRIGMKGKLFPCLKLRTLPRSTPRYASKYQIEVTDGFPGLLRRTHLDELPQLLLVPLGWMSLVGPRPEMPNVFSSIPEDYASMRVQVPQGCSGLWQIGPHTTGLLHESPEYDYFYVENASLRLDAWILCRSLLLMTGLGRPVGLDEVPEWAKQESMAPARVRGFDLLTDIEPAEAEAL